MLTSRAGRKEGTPPLNLPSPVNYFNDIMTWFDASVEKPASKEATFQQDAFPDLAIGELPVKGIDPKHSSTELITGLEEHGKRESACARCQSSNWCFVHEQQREGDQEYRPRPVKTDLDQPDCATQKTLPGVPHPGPIKSVRLVTWRYDDEDEPYPTAFNRARTYGKNITSKEFVTKLEAGDSIALWIKGGEGNWMNVVDRVKIHIYWAV